MRSATDSSNAVQIVWSDILFSGGSRGGAPPPLILGKKEEMTEGRKAGRASETKPPRPPAPLAQGLDPPLLIDC